MSALISKASNHRVDIEVPVGTLYIVATPIGHLGDISHRALKVLADVDTILAEDTRHSKRLLNHYGIVNSLRSCHEHNEAELLGFVDEQLTEGKNLALISDAGTPLISDPGFVLVRGLREQGHSICTVPGPSSVIAALSIAGLPTDRFVFDGFLPAKSSARQKQLEDYLQQERTIVLLESSHRITASVRDMVAVLGADRQLVLARELTKKFETVLAGPASEILANLETDSDQSRGEFVVLLKGVEHKLGDSYDIEKLLKTLVAELPLKQATTLAAKISGRNKNELYKLALTLKE